MQGRAATLENSVYAMDFFGLLGNVPAIAAEAQKVSRARMDHWNEEARKYLLKEHGINVPLIEVMENVNGVGVIRQDTERNYKNLRAALDKPFFFVQRASLSLLGVVWPLTCPSSSTSMA